MSKSQNPDGKPAKPHPKSPAKVRRRRKDARPSEIIDAALAVFSEHGFGAAKIEEVASRAGVSKGTVFVYFANKEELFRAVAQHLLATHLDGLPGLSGALDIGFAEFVPLLLGRAAGVGDGPAPAMIRLLLAEARRFPDIAQVWYDEVVSKVFAVLVASIRKAQERGEVRAGDPQLFAFSLVGPLLAGTIFREIMRATDATLPDLSALAGQHGELVLRGMLVAPDGA